MCPRIQKLWSQVFPGSSPNNLVFFYSKRADTLSRRNLPGSSHITWSIHYDVAICIPTIIYANRLPTCIANAWLPCANTVHAHIKIMAWKASKCSKHYRRLGLLSAPYEHTFSHKRILFSCVKYLLLSVCAHTSTTVCSLLVLHAAQVLAHS